MHLQGDSKVFGLLVENGNKLIREIAASTFPYVPRRIDIVGNSRVIKFICDMCGSNLKEKDCEPDCPSVEVSLKMYLQLLSKHREKVKQTYFQN